MRQQKGPADPPIISNAASSGALALLSRFAAFLSFSLQLIMQQRENSVGGGGLLGRAVLVEHVHFGALPQVLHDDAILLLGFLRIAAALELEA